MLRTATTLDRWIGGRTITAASVAAFAPSLVGDRVTAVEAQGKHVLIRLESGRVVHSHMRMQGQWHVYPTGRRWRQPAFHARLVIETGERLAVCFSAPVVELLAAKEERVHAALAGLGPDVLDDPLDVDGILARVARRPPETEMGDLLLDQRVLSGIGNIYRCETLFLAGVHPRTPRSAVDDDAMAAIARTAARLLHASVTLGAHKRWVYGRAGRPCRRCQTIIDSARVGTQLRTAYWCPRCQPW